MCFVSLSKKLSCSVKTYFCPKKWLLWYTPYLEYCQNRIQTKINLCFLYSTVEYSSKLITVYWKKLNQKRLITDLVEECLVFEPPDIYPAPWSAHRLSRGRTVIGGWHPGNHPAVASLAPDLAQRMSSRTCPSILCVYNTILFIYVYKTTSVS